jgi:hypothetical protein
MTFCITFLKYFLQKFIWTVSYKNLEEFFFRVSEEIVKIIYLRNSFGITTFKKVLLTKSYEKIILKTFYEYTPCGLYYKSFTIVIYDRNDSGQYCKTTITAEAH